MWQRQAQTPKTKTALRQFAVSPDPEAIAEHVRTMQQNSYGLVFAAESGRPDPAP
jgi:hypothetical protein